MSENPTVEDTKRKLEELEQRIRAAKSSLGAKGEIVSGAQKDWNAMLATHAEIRRKLEAVDDPSAHVLDGVRLDIDVLRNSFERWMARVEGNFDQDAGRKGGHYRQVRAARKMLAAAVYRPPHAMTQKAVALDDVDLRRQIARNLEADFLLTHLRLVPNFHGVSSLNGERREDPPPSPQRVYKGRP